MVQLLKNRCNNKIKLQLHEVAAAVLYHLSVLPFLKESGFTLLGCE